MHHLFQHGQLYVVSILFFMYCDSYSSAFSLTVDLHNRDGLFTVRYEQKLYVLEELLIVRPGSCRDRFLFAGFSPRRPGVDPMSVRVRGRFFSQDFSFPLSVSFHHCCFPARVCVLFLRGRRVSFETCQKAVLFRKSGSVG